MSPLTAYSTAADGYLRGYHATYATARGASTGKYLSNTASSIYIGQNWVSGDGFYCYEGFLDFDTSDIPDDATITSATLSLYGYVDSSTTDFTIQARIFDWSASGLTTADWRSGDPTDANSLDEYTLVASLSTASYATGQYNALTSEAAFVANINKSGTTYLVLNSSRHLNGDEPSGLELVRVYSNEQGEGYIPKLVVEYTGGDSFVGMTVTKLLQG